MSTKPKSPEDLERELSSQRQFVHTLDTMVANQIASYLILRTKHVLRIFEIKRLLGIKKIRNIEIEQEKLTLLGEVTKKLGLPRPMLTPFFRSVFRYARWVQVSEKKKKK